MMLMLAKARSTAVQSTHESADLATKGDLLAFKTELKNDILAVKTELKSDIALIRADMREMELRIAIKLGGIVVLAMGAMAGAVAAIVKQ